MDWAQIVLVISALTSFGTTVWTFAVVHTKVNNQEREIATHKKNCREDKNKIWDELRKKADK